MRKRFLCIICCSMLAFSGCGVGSSVVNSGNYESKNQSNTIEKFKGLWISDLGENDIFINKDGKMSRGIAYSGDFDFEGNVIKFELKNSKIFVDNGIYFTIKKGKLTRYENNSIAGTYTAGESLDKISSSIHFLNNKESTWEKGVFAYSDLTFKNSENQDEDYYDEDSQIYDVQSKYLKAIQDYSGTELNDLTPDKNIENFEYPEDESSMQKELNELKKTLQEVYGSNVEISFEQSSFEEFDVQKLNNALSEDDDEDGGDVDTIETLNKTMKDVVETGCNLQRCIKSDMTFRMSGDKGEDTQTVASYIYEVDGEYYMDTYAFDKLLQGQKMALEEKQSGNSDYSTADLNLDQYDGEDLNYSSLLLDQR
ncbi:MULTISPECIES: hypothetical protein [Clostridia]|jgi:hypothetical protein|uniref:Uncharacterized protein n=1 Tax=Butyribacter intestini TaxID=1703332 RepID=A0AAW3JQL5_9FIRM|nr:MULTISPECIES: hypothetical protein [Clostridia]UYJ41589.1 MAG: hypothetical protein OGM15_04525 [Lachnospiraceae bacterium]KQC84997.1 hypothetical protein APZ18_09805 [Butyribacter intestini]RHP24934.1 hypothetical protein DWZ63_09290 [Clostridium sp. AF34-13]RHT95916.1 hypothetical protein DW721_00635 [Clostridium sp. AM27-31LB]RHU74278.1 hypothetical protein DXC30_09920 [Butyribacter intestini]